VGCDWNHGVDKVRAAAKFELPGAQTEPRMPRSAESAINWILYSLGTSRKADQQMDHGSLWDGLKPAKIKSETDEGM
jgi:hypothetical protein